MILLTRLTGDEIYLNPDLIERIETTPETVVSLVDGRRYVVAEAPAELIRRIVAFRASVLVMAENESASAASAGPQQQIPTPRALRLLDDPAHD